MIHELERRTREWTETQDVELGELGHLDYAESFVASGGTMVRLADEISDAVGFEISRDMLKRYLAEGRRDEANKRLAEARHDGAHGLVEEAMRIVDDAPTGDKEQLAKAKMKAETRLWAAERWNRNDLGRSAEVSIVVNNNTLHLDAMRKRVVEQEKSAPALPLAHARSSSALRQLGSGDTILATVDEEDES